MFYKRLNVLLLVSLLMVMAFVAISITSSKAESATSNKSTEVKKTEASMAKMDMPMVDPKAELAKVIEKGKMLFNDPKLGKSGMSCNSCHPNGETAGGKVMDMPVPTLKGAAATFPKYKMGAKSVITLQQMDNMCIQMIMKGTPQKFDGAESIALAAYVTSLSNGMPVMVGETVKAEEK